ncbi:MAG: transcription-repair coupling factor [Chloroflexota bacterium]|nr:transcription-repair coupling factor [Dehalococcoidia bacterium]MDW8252839.1 transcription-repair coupling factor [Chloroflexota bacterium]
MNLAGLLGLLRHQPAFTDLLTEMAAGRPVVLRALRAATPALVAALSESSGRPLLIVTGRTERAKALADQLTLWMPDQRRIFLFPEPEGLPYERALPDPITAQRRLRALDALLHSPHPVVVAGVQSILPFTLRRRDLEGRRRVLRVGDRVRLEALLAFLVDAGYEAAAAVTAAGTFARRGGILDIFSPTEAAPVRVELFGDEIESLRAFDPVSQRSTALVTEVTIGPAREHLATAIPELDLSGLSEEARGRLRADLDRLRAGETFDGIDFYAGLLPHASIFDYLPPGAVLVVDDPRDVRLAAEGLVEQAMSLRDALIARREIPPSFPLPHLSVDELLTAIERHRCRLELTAWGAEDPRARSLPLGPVEAFAGRLNEWFRRLADDRRAGRPIVVTSFQAGRLRELLEERGLTPRVDDSPSPPAPGEIVLTSATIEEGWQLEGGLVLYSDRELFGLAKVRRLAPERPRAAPPPANFLADLKPGDYVVHVEHGIGRFAGLTTRSIEGGAAREYLILEYAEGDRLLVPTDHLDRVSRYIGGAERTPSLTRLSSGEWARSKARVKKAVEQVARDLLRLYALRAVSPGRAFGPDTPWQRELEDSFPYVETPDQLIAIEETKRDLERPRPMDRLICGDVGYGKTEVAIRAAFKVVQEGAQVAVLVPTTVLAQQHLHTFQERLAAFPVTIEMLSRLKSEKEQQRILAGLAQGSIDIVIGTHRLIQKDVQFKNLGLVVVDEEQRFGVVHKEQLKRMRAEVHVLTMTATPIPRTLHQALVGVRDLSRIDTPPEARLAIKTTAAEYNETLVRQAILRELDRGGQVFYVHNRVATIEAAAERLRRLVPEARIAVGHGQMPEEQLERVMIDFAAGAYDVLVCTTIIESGLDLPNANTIIITDAHRFGLAQLYQLRGRVGRGANRAYAYLLFPRDQRLSEVAERRLRAILEASELGAGYQIALRDLEIRGAGNLLGVEQSGHIDAVGFDLYTRLLGEAIAELKASLEGRPVESPTPPPAPAPLIDLGLPAYLPPDFVEDQTTRLLLYQRLVEARTPGEVEDLADEIRDRFGELPEPARNLLFIATLRTLAAGRGVETIATRDGAIVVQVAGRLDRAKLERLLGRSVRIGVSQVHIPRGRNGWAETLRKTVEAVTA